MPEQATALDLANYVRARVPELKDQPDHLLIKYLFERYPEFKQDTLLASRQEISKNEFEANLPAGMGRPIDREDTISMDGRGLQGKPAYAVDAGLREMILGGLQSLGVDPANPITGTLKNWGQAALTTAKAVGSPSAQYDLAKGVGKGLVEGPVGMAKAKTPVEFGTGAGQTLAQTVPAAYGAFEAAKAAPGMAKAMIDPETMRLRAEANRLPPPPTTLASVAQDAITTGVGQLVAGPKGAAAVESVNLLRRTKPYRNFKAGVQEKLADWATPKREPVSYTIPDTKPGFETPGPIDRADPASSASLDERMRSSAWDKTEPTPWQSGPLGVPRPAPKPMPPPPSDLNGGLSEVKSFGPREDVPFTPPDGWSDTKAPSTTPTSGGGKLPKSLIHQDVLNGIMPETLNLLGRDKLYAIAKDTERIMKDSGYNALDSIDNRVGGKDMRIRVLSTPEGQNLVMNFVNALKRQSAKDVMFYSKSLQDLAQRIK